MNEPTQHYGDQAQEFRGDYTLTGADDANIDPLLSMYTSGGHMPPDVSNPMDSQLFVGSALWNPALNNPVNFYASGMSGVAPTTSTGSPNSHKSPNSPKAPTETQSSPRTLSSEPMFQSSRTSSKSSIPSTADNDTKPRRSSRGSKAQTQRQQTSAEPISQPPRRRKSVQEPTLKEEEEDDEDGIGLDEDAKRTKFLKRNRIAASKCRQKKKEWVNNLEDTRYDLEHENTALHKQYNGLVDELSNVKNQLMLHASCNDANINRWLDNEAKRYIQRLTEQSQMQNLSQQHRNTGDCCDNHRRSSSVATSIPRSIE